MQRAATQGRLEKLTELGLYETDDVENHLGSHVGHLGA